MPLRSNWLRRLLVKFSIRSRTPTTLYSIHNPLLHLLEDGSYHADKRIDNTLPILSVSSSRWHHQTVYCPTDDMTADTLAKALLCLSEAFRCVTWSDARLEGECWIVKVKDSLQVRFDLRLPLLWPFLLYLLYSQIHHALDPRSIGPYDVYNYCCATYFLLLLCSRADHNNSYSQ